MACGSGETELLVPPEVPTWVRDPVLAVPHSRVLSLSGVISQTNNLQASPHLTLCFQGGTQAKAQWEVYFERESLHGTF